jgi:hypothetical protein
VIYLISKVTARGTEEKGFHQHLMPNETPRFAAGIQCSRTLPICALAAMFDATALATSDKGTTSGIVTRFKGCFGHARQLSAGAAGASGGNAATH